MLVRTGAAMYRRKITFQFFKMWIDHPEFEGIVQEAWNARVAGTP